MTDDRCCPRHHYSCLIGEDGPPFPCCPACPGNLYPATPLFPHPATKDTP